ncbi:hypothetical protein Q7P36_002964 [Cladosporium allicinum]
MPFKTLTQALALSLAIAPAASNCDQLHALVYRGPTASEGLPESLRDLLVASHPNINVTFAGPNEPVKINAKSLSHVDILAQPGGPVANRAIISDLQKAWKEAKPYASDVRNFVAGGGRYLGVCLGAFLAGHNPGLGLIPKGDNVVREINQKGAQVDDEKDTTIQTDWTFSTGDKRGKTESRRWLYFQDGAAFRLSPKSSAKVLGRYSKNGDVAAILSPFGEGWVANVGPHPEADETWYEEAEITNPEGVRNDIGRDLVQALLSASKSKSGPTVY